MSDILNKIVAVKHQEIEAALKRKSLAAMRADAESRVLTRDFVGALRAKIAAGLPAITHEGLPGTHAGAVIFAITQDRVSAFAIR